MRAKSNLVQPEPPKIEHGCLPHEVAARRASAANARRELYEAAYGLATGEEGAKFADWSCASLGDIGRLYVAMEEGMEPGRKYLVRVARE